MIVLYIQLGRALRRKWKTVCRDIVGKVDEGTQVLPSIVSTLWVKDIVLQKDSHRIKKMFGYSF